MVLVILPLYPIGVSKDSLKIWFEYHEISSTLQVHINSSYHRLRKLCVMLEISALTPCSLANRAMPPRPGCLMQQNVVLNFYCIRIVLVTSKLVSNIVLLQSQPDHQFSFRNIPAGKNESFVGHTPTHFA